MNKKELTQFLIDQPNVDNDEIGAAVAAGLTITDIEWNQRLDRPWLFHNKDTKKEAALREQWFVDNGLDAATAKANVAAGY